MNLELKDKIAIITGGASGIGKEIASLLVGEGAKVVIGDIDKDKSIKAVEEINAIEGASDKASNKFIDVMKEDSVFQIVNEVKDEYGRIDILINSAGYISISNPNEIDVSEWDKMMAINARGVFLTSKAVSKYMIEQKYGKIVNISSQASKMGYPHESHYSASKAAVNGYTRSLACYLAQFNVNVNAICPGSIDTEMNRRVATDTANVLGVSFEQKWQETIDHTPLKRKGTVQDIANMAVFLVSEKTSFITGQTINITGGRVMH